MKQFWESFLEVLRSQGQKKQMNLAVIIPLVIFVFTVLVWEHYISSDLLYNRIIISNVIIVLGALFSTAVGCLIWSLERNVAYAEHTKAFLGRIIKSTIAPLFVIDFEGNIKIVNEAVLKMLQYEEMELIRQPAERIVTDSHPLKSDMPELMRKGFVGPVECVFRTKLGKLVPVLFSASIIKDESGKTHGIVCVSQDISDRKKLEQQLFRARQLEFVGRLTSGVAHDFNNLLSAVAGLSEFLLDELDKDNPLYQDAQQINQLAISGSQMTRQLLAFSRRQITQPEVVDLNEIIFRMSTVIRKMLGEDIELVVIPGQDLAPVEIDPGQFEQVLLNLMTNARDAMPEGGKIVIKTDNVPAGLDDELASNIPDGKASVLFMVQDTGMGMSEEVKQRIFEPFFSTKAEGKGFGLGLATVFDFIKQAKGHVTVESRIRAGTTFRIYFPQTERKEKLVSAKEVQTKPMDGKERILVVEDEPLVRALAGQALRSHGYEVIEASNGSEALHWLEQHRSTLPDLLFTDLVMPQIGGRELAKRMSEISPAAKILFTSGYVLGPDEASSDFGAFLKKPFTPTSLCIKVREVLDAR